MDRRPSNSRGEAGRLKRDVHRGRGGANLTNTARGTPSRRRTCGYSDFSTPRCCEVSRSAGPTDPWRPARPRYFFESGRLVAPKPVRAKADGKWTTACPGPQRIRVMTHVCFSNRPSGVKRFQTIHHCSVDVAHGLVLLSGIGAGPFHYGIRGRGGTIFWTALPSVERQVQADIRTHLIRRPARDIFPPFGGTRVSSCRFYRI